MANSNNNANNFADSEAFEKASLKLQKFEGLSTADKIRYCNAQATPDVINDFPLVTDYEGVRITPNGCTMSVIEGFTPLIDRQSGAGLTTISTFGIKFSKVEKVDFTVTVPRLTAEEIAQGGDLFEILKKKALATIVAKWNPNDGSGTQEFQVGKPTIMPSGSTPLFWSNSRGHLIPTGRLSKPNFKFVFEKLLGKAIALPVGKDPKTCTRVQVHVQMKGTWIGKSEAEKFCSTMSKLCLDPFVIPESLLDLIYGGIALYDGDASLDAILKGEEPMLPFAMTYSGQETLKGASSAEEAAQFVKDNTGASVLRESKPVEGHKGLLTHDSDEFVAFRNSFVIAASAKVWVARWIDSSLLEIYAKNKSLHIIPHLDGALLFHRTTVRIVNKPLTLETSTQLENCNSDGTGRMFLGLQSVVENISPACAVLAAVLNATAFEDKVLVDIMSNLLNPVSLEEGVTVFETGHNHMGQVKILKAQPGMIIPLECDPLVTFKNVAKIWGDTFVVKWGDKATLVSPFVATKLGYAPGGNLELYSKVFLELCGILTLEDENHFEAEMSQWWSANITVLANIIKGGDTAKMQSKCNLLKKGTRAKGVMSVKAGSIVGQGITQGYFYVSEDSPFASRRGEVLLRWRNPMPFIGIRKVAVVGTNPATCDVLIPERLSGKALAFNKGYEHPTDISETFGDIDGDSLQFLFVKDLLEWAVHNEATIKKNKGLWEALIQFNFISD